MTENVVLAVPPAGTVTLRGLLPPTAQVEATPDSATLWLVAERPL